jgi:Tetratricopeptide repeat/Cytochrome c554 and c-prime
MAVQPPDESVAGRPAPARARRRVVWAVLLGVTGVLLVAGLVLVFHSSFTLHPSSSAAPRDPRRDYAGPFRNVDPAVRYVAEERCADCHAAIARTFAEHPRGRSLLPAAAAPAPPADAGHDNPFDALGSRFRVEREGDRLRHRRTRLDAAGRPAAELAWDVDYVIGSGTRGHSYLADRDGFLFQTPVSWYSQKGAWGLAPGFTPPRLTGRPVLPECLFCHANRAHYVEGSVNRYEEPVFEGHAIGCQRCHGPGELHVAARERLEPVAGPVDATIVNPAHLEPTVREAVCEQCHLEGEARVVHRGRGVYDFRPGLPLELFWSVFVAVGDPGEGRRAVSHVEQMDQSGCYRGGTGADRLGCISCHDPHERVPPERRVAYYRGRCLQCHAQRGCSLPRAERLRQSAEDSCIDCHMPRYGTSDIPHTASTDHRIPRRPGPTVDARLGVGDGWPLVSFYGGREGAGGAEGDRDLAVALVNQAFTGDAAAARALGRALPLLDAAVRRDPDDAAAGEARGFALVRQGRPAEALAAFEAVLARAPGREAALAGAASTAEALGRTEAAVGYWRRTVAADPWVPDSRRSLALLLIKKEAWDEARAECEAWVRLDPMSAEARAARVSCLLAAGDKEEARAEFARVEALAPVNLTELQARFRKKLR